MSTTDEWSTPMALFSQLDREFHFTLDPCATPHNAKCVRYFTKHDDGLQHSWAGERVFMNPPFGHQIGEWIKKAACETQAFVVALIPARTDTRYWHSYIWDSDHHRPKPGVKLRFIKGRLKYGSGKYPAPFPSVIVIFSHLISVFICVYLWSISGVPIA